MLKIECHEKTKLIKKMDFQVLLLRLEMILISAIFVYIHCMFNCLFDILMKYFRCLILFFSILGILACSDSRHKSENNTAAVNDQEAVQAKPEPGLLTEDQTKLQENPQNTNFQDASKEQALSPMAKDSIDLKLEADSIAKEIAIAEEKISISRKKILNYQEELKFYKSQLSKLNTDESMRNYIDRINQNVETVRGYIEIEEEKINLGKIKISKLEKEKKDLNIRHTQASTTISKKSTREKTDTKLDQQHSGPINKQALEKELNDLKELNKEVNARILYFEHILDSLNFLDQKSGQEQLKPVIISKEKKLPEDTDQQAANQLQELASKTINQKKNMSAEQVKTAKERNSSDTTINRNRGFAKFVSIFFLIILALTGSLYFLGKSFPGKKKIK